MIPPSKLLAVLLDRKGIASFPINSESNSTSEFTINYGQRMSQEDSDDQWVTLTDYGQMIGTRSMNTGRYEEHPRIQVRARGTDYDVCYAKIHEIKTYLLEDDNGDGLANQMPLLVDIDGDLYRLQCVSLVNGPFFMGEEDKNNRLSFALNLQITMRLE